MRSSAEPSEYQLGRPGLVNTAGVEVSTEPSLVSGIDELPTPNRALRTQLIRACVAAVFGVVNSAWSCALPAFAVVKS